MSKKKKNYRAKHLFIGVSLNEPLMLRHADAHPELFVVGIDLFFSAAIAPYIAKAKHNNLSIKVEDAADMKDEEDNSYDFIQIDYVLSNGMNHINPKAGLILEGCWRVLRPGGMLYVLDFSPIPFDISDMLHENKFINITSIATVLPSSFAKRYCKQHNMDLDAYSCIKPSD